MYLCVDRTNMYLSEIVFYLPIYCIHIKKMKTEKHTVVSICVYVYIMTNNATHHVYHYLSMISIDYMLFSSYIYLSFSLSSLSWYRDAMLCCDSCVCHCSDHPCMHPLKLSSILVVSNPCFHSIQFQTLPMSKKNPHPFC